MGLVDGKGFFLFIMYLSLSIQIACGWSDTFTSAIPLKDGNRNTIVSSGGIFEIGFFSPMNSKNRYIGIWYKNIPPKTVVWVANRDTPLTNKSGMFKLTDSGILSILNDKNTIIWSSDNTSRTTNNPIAQLLDSGNLVVRDMNDVIWQSFDYPSDTFLPEMKIGKDLVTGHENYITSWKSDDDPSKGDYTYGCDLHGYPHQVIKKGQILLYRSEPWNGIDFGGISVLPQNAIYKFDMVFNQKQVFFTYKMINSSMISRLTMNRSGVLQRWVWSDQVNNWVVYFSKPTPDGCDMACGASGSCNTDSFPKCGCLDKFVPKYQNEWNGDNWSKGCVRRKPLDCKTDGFIKHQNVKLPDPQNSLFYGNLTLVECEKLCVKNCSCMAYANIFKKGFGCMIWMGDLVDIQEAPSYTFEVYIRVAFSELGSRKKKEKVIPLIMALVGGLSIILGLILFIWRELMKNSVPKGEDERMGKDTDQLYKNESQKDDLELPLLNLSEIAKATHNFSFDNKLGEGGYGPVYKGVLPDGKEVAVKRLSKTSNQGLDEFKNEVICISKLQHRNLVRLLGCCIQGDEKMLIYEYMPNKSLDYFIFDESRRKLLDWAERFNIMNGIARGLQYLHEDSRLRIIHRDLKASNILLDFHMIPKISDFGMARSFIGNEIQANTMKVVGTYGYMSPEYAVDGLFSVKSDVFSFGVLVLEIVTGKKNRGFFHHDHHHNLLGHAWILYQEGRSVELIDENLSESWHLYQVLRSIEVALLCVQRNPEDRPSMSSVAVMLSSDSQLPQPKQPGFFYTEHLPQPQDDMSSTTRAPSSTTAITITLVHAR
ncbi:G-type lectin S-receptor-like serine/threonine-protein kinase At4g27290 isoform X1 [Lactuca sativa]|uniref:G-type lectin S-receptor-like serine/threonine-protein kinase At4g27290 isoform X1 n=2 Tax=Lactuca sativa TaxID=4236 RepID=UPI0022AEB615|nr:G-type lectin S-receptor-like serine/threonine-protein kinase At4g27290 isoform X1 [Lactuca sativa]XP_052620090.1 G-type lectin S-receptor-like serine/threonine-protein kinase At4g27290 isoform X1 [Lactuca sativa]